MKKYIIAGLFTLLLVSSAYSQKASDDEKAKEGLMASIDGEGNIKDVKKFQANWNILNKDNKLKIDGNCRKCTYNGGILQLNSPDDGTKLIVPDGSFEPSNGPILCNSYDCNCLGGCKGSGFKNMRGLFNQNQNDIYLSDGSVGNVELREFEKGHYDEYTDTFRAIATKGAFVTLNGDQDTVFDNSLVVKIPEGAELTKVGDFVSITIEDGAPVWTQDKEGNLRKKFSAKGKTVLLIGHDSAIQVKEGSLETRDKEGNLIQLAGYRISINNEGQYLLEPVDDNAAASGYVGYGTLTVGKSGVIPDLSFSFQDASFVSFQDPLDDPQSLQSGIPENLRLTSQLLIEDFENNNPQLTKNPAFLTSLVGLKYALGQRVSGEYNTNEGTFLFTIQRESGSPLPRELGIGTRQEITDKLFIDNFCTIYLKQGDFILNAGLTYLGDSAEYNLDIQYDPSTKGLTGTLSYFDNEVTASINGFKYPGESGFFLNIQIPMSILESK